MHSGVFEFGKCRSGSRRIGRRSEIIAVEWVSKHVSPAPSLFPGVHRLIAYLVASSAFVGTAAGDFSLNVLAWSATVPAASTAQIQFSLAKPLSVATGELNVDLDPAVFGAVTAVTAFSVSGDAYGFATVDGGHVNMKFWSPSGALGGIAGNPMIALTVTILLSAAPGSRARPGRTSPASC